MAKEVKISLPEGVLAPGVSSKWRGSVEVIRIPGSEQKKEDVVGEATDNVDAMPLSLAPKSQGACNLQRVEGEA